MRILYLYIARTLVTGWLITALVLTTVFGLIFFIQELEHTAQSYQVPEVVRFVLMILPQEMFKLTPVITLLGTIMALAGLDRYNELTIISSCGVPRKKLLAAVMLPTLLLMVALWLSMEYLAAPLHQKAAQLRFSARNNNSVILPDGGVWSRHGNRYMQLGKIKDGVPGRIRLYEFDDDGLLIRYLRAPEAEIDEDRGWKFRKVRQKRIVNGRMHTTTPRELEIDNLWSQRELPTVTTAAENMSLSVLFEYARYLDDNGQDSEKYMMSFWQRLLMPLTAAAMALLATPVSAGLGSGRSGNFGINMAIGAAIGIGFYLVAQITYSLGQLLGMNLLLTCLLPTSLVLLCALWLLGRMRW